LVGYSPDGRPSPALLQLADGFVRNGIDLHVCLIVEKAGLTSGTASIPGAASVSERLNDSYDFGAWAAMLQVLPDAFAAERIIFANDSVVVANPAAFDALLAGLADEKADFTALTDCNLPFHHTQSYFFQVRAPLIADRRLVAFWASIPQGAGKEDIIAQCETPLLALVQADGRHATSVRFSIAELFNGAAGASMLTDNPTHFFWERLLLRGFPFIKAELLFKNPMGLNIGHWPVVVQSLGGDVEIVNSHLAEMERARRILPMQMFRAKSDETALTLSIEPSAAQSPKDAIKLNRMSGLSVFLLGAQRASRLREWNRMRRHRRKIARIAAELKK
jgi:hypothetical protein